MPRGYNALRLVSIIGDALCSFCWITHHYACISDARALSSSAVGCSAVLAPAREDREVRVLEEAVGVPQASRAPPAELRGDIGAAIDAHADLGLIDLLLARAGSSAVSAPQLAVCALKPRRRPGDMLGVDERTARAQRVVHAREQLAPG